MHYLLTCCEGSNGSCSRAWFWAAIFSVVMEMNYLCDREIVGKGSLEMLNNRQ